MEVAIQAFSYLVGIPLQILTIAALLRGGYRRFPLVFAYVIASFLASVTEMPGSFTYLRTQKQVSRTLVRIYYTNEVILQVLIFAVVISLIYQASARMGSRRLFRAVLLTGAAVFAIVSFAVHFDSKTHLGMWMTPWSRDLKFCATILDLALWALLIGSVQRDRLLMMLSGAMGILFTGEAIGESIRNLATQTHSAPLTMLGSIVIVLADLVCFWIWWQVFRRESPLNGSNGPT